MFKDRFASFKKNPIEWGLCLIILFLLPIDVYQFIDSGFLVEPLLRCIFEVVLAFSLLLVGEKCVVMELLVFSLVLVQFITFKEYTPFIIICFCGIIRKNKITFLFPVLNCYFIDVVIVCMRHEKTPLHLIRHFIICFVIFCIIQLLFYFLRRDKPLDLTDEERKILDSLVVHGLKQKEIEGFKQNTVAKNSKGVVKRIIVWIIMNFLLDIRMKWTKT